MAADWASLPRDRFGDHPVMQDELAALVVAGRKTATCMAEAGEAPVPLPGSRTLIEDGAGRPVCVIETLSVERRRFDEVDEAHAQAEGEGDLSLGYWRRVHRAYFRREGRFAEDMPLLCDVSASWRCWLRERPARLAPPRLPPGAARRDP